MEFEITTQINGVDIPCGRLFTHVRRGVESATFSYHPSYLERNDTYALSPDLPLVEGSIHTMVAALFCAFEDCMPDRWGRNLMTRAERAAARAEARTARTLHEEDFLAGVSDIARQGAIRVWADGVAVSTNAGGVPREVDLPHLLTQADLAASDMNADIRDLLRAGSSLGGARPKASIVNERGTLCIAKLPRTDESPHEDTCAWEHVASVLAGQAGITVPRTRLIRIAGRAVLLLERFDRSGEVRIPYLSGLSAIQGADGGDFSYLELVDFLETDGARPTDDIRQLWRRVLFSCAIGNTDDHMRNHAFLRSAEGWILSPQFDVNPTEGDHDKYLSCAIDFDEHLASPTAALDACEFFRMGQQEAKAIAHQMGHVLRGWRRVASRDGISKAATERMASCFDAAIERLEKL